MRHQGDRRHRHHDRRAAPLAAAASWRHAGHVNQVLSLKGDVFLDSAGLGAVVSIRRRLQVLGGALVLACDNEMSSGCCDSPASTTSWPSIRPRPKRSATGSSVDHGHLDAGDPRGRRTASAATSLGRLGATPLGEPETWPPSLQRRPHHAELEFAMWMAWGPELTFFCNDAYRPTRSVSSTPGRSGPRDEVWAEIWPDIGPRIEHVLSTGEATWDEALLLFLERSGYPEETYHTFSYSPLADDDGAIAGMLCVVTEETERVIGERRLRTLRDLGDRRGDAPTGGGRGRGRLRPARREPAIAARSRWPTSSTPTASARLAGPRASRAGHRGGAGGIAADDADAPWPVARARCTASSVVVDGLDERFGRPADRRLGRAAAAGARRAAAAAGPATPYGFLVVGLNPHRPLDDGVSRLRRAGRRPVRRGHHRRAGAIEQERARAEALAELDRAKTASSPTSATSSARR